MDDIEKFLRNAAARRRQQQQGQRQPPAPAAPPPRKSPPTEIEYVEPEIVEADIYAGDTVAEHVAHIANESFKRRAADLGEEVGLADEHLEERLHETFEHEIGRLKDTSVGDAIHEAAEEAADEATDSPHEPEVKGISPHDIANLFRSPQNIRQAIILSEILSRPEDRW